MAQTEVEKSVSDTADVTGSPPPNDESPTEFAIAAMKRGLRSIVTVIRYYIKGIAYQIAGAFGGLLIFGVIGIPYTMFIELGISSGAAIVVSLLVSALVFLAYGAGALKFERTREAGKAANRD